MSSGQSREEYEMSAPSTSAGLVGAESNAQPAHKGSLDALRDNEEEDKDKDKDEKDEAQEKAPGLGPYFVSHAQRAN